VWWRWTIGNQRGKKEKYKRILEAAVKVFADLGFHQSTISQIAREAGVADGTIYLYFKNKDDILVQFFSYKTKQVFDRFKEAVDSADAPVEKLRNLIQRHLSEFQRDRNMAIVYLAETRRKNRVVEKQIRIMSKMYFDLVAEIIAQGQQNGTIRSGLYLGLVKHFILGSVDEAINTWLHSGDKYDLASMTDPLVDLFIKGIGNTLSPTKQEVPKIKSA
jgi:TetR/AcrR family transcriptional regulator, fatty acid metabolism regulator protein